LGGLASELHEYEHSKPSFLSVKQSGKKSALKNLQGERQRLQHVMFFKQRPPLLHVLTVEETKRPSLAFSVTARSVKSKLKLSIEILP